MWSLYKDPDGDNVFEDYIIHTPQIGLSGKEDQGNFYLILINITCRARYFLSKMYMYIIDSLYTSYFR